MPENLVARATITVDAPREKVWHALVDAAAIEEYMFGTHVETDWRVGSPIAWRGDWQGKPYEDKGMVKQVEPNRLLEYTHFSPLAGLPDAPENYHTVSIELTADGDRTRVALAQDNNPDAGARDLAATTWGTILEGVKKVAER